MPADLEQRLRAASPPLPEPGAEATERARAVALGRSRTRGVGAARWGGSRTARLLIAAALLTAAGGAVAATLLRETSAARPAPAPLRWGPAELLSGRFGGSIVPAVAVGGNGDALLAWLHGVRLDARLHPAGGRWGPAQTLSSAGAIASGPAAAMDAAGNTTVVWRERRAERVVTLRLRLSSGAPAGVLRGRVGESFVVVSRRRAAGGDWGPAEELSVPSRNGRDAVEPQIAIAADGTAVAAWPAASWVEVRTRPPGGAWGPTARLDAGGLPREVRLALDPSGAAGIVWTTRRRDRQPTSAGPRQVYVVRAALRAAGGVWQPPVDVSGALPSAPGRARIAVDRHLLAAVVWSHMRIPLQGQPGSRVEAAVHRPGGAWSAPRPLDPDAPATPPRVLGDPRATVGIDADGTIVAVFGRIGGAAFATLAPDGTPSPAQPLGDGPFGWHALTPYGDGLVLVAGTQSGGLALRSWRPGGGWMAARVVAGSGRAYSPALAARPGSGAILAWTQFRGLGSSPLQIRAALARPEIPSRGG
jgi:hypothetical protein